MAPVRTLQLNDNRDWRGGERQTFLLSKALMESGHPVVLAAHPDGELFRRSREAGIDVFPAPARGELNPSAIRQVRQAIVDVRPEVVHAHTPHTQSQVLLAGFGNTSEFRLVVSRRVDKSIHRLPLRLSGLKYWYGVDRYVAISQAVKRRLTSDGVDERRIGQVFEGLEPEVADSTPAANLEALFGVPPDATVIMTVAVLDRSKGHHIILEAAPEILRAHPEARFMFVGDGPELQSLQRQVEKLGLENAVIFTGFRDDVVSLIAACDLFVMPSFSEGLCTSVMDAMFLHRPVIVSNAGGMPELILDRERGRVTPVGDAQQLAAAICETLDDEAQACTRAQNARAWAIEHITVDAMMKGTLSEYAIALGG